MLALRKFAGGPVGSSTGLKYGSVLDDQRAYRVLDSWCRKYFARGFKLYKLYERAATFVGHAPSSARELGSAPKGAFERSRPALKMGRTPHEQLRIPRLV